MRALGSKSSLSCPKVEWRLQVSTPLLVLWLVRTVAALRHWLAAETLNLFFEEPMKTHIQSCSQLGAGIADRTPCASDCCSWLQRDPCTPREVIMPTSLRRQSPVSSSFHYRHSCCHPSLWCAERTQHSFHRNQEPTRRRLNSMRYHHQTDIPLFKRQRDAVFHSKLSLRG